MLDLLTSLSPHLLRGLAPDEVSAFARLCRKTAHPDQTKLFHEDQEAKSLYLLVEGTINLCFEMPGGRGCETMVLIEQPGSTIGFSILVPPHRYHSSGYCHGPATLVEIEREALQSLLETNYHMAYILMRNVAELVGVRLYQIQGKLSKILGDEVIDGW